jgi:hypothetical protein
MSRVDVSPVAAMDAVERNCQIDLGVSRAQGACVSPLSKFASSVRSARLSRLIAICVVGLSMVGSTCSSALATTGHVQADSVGAFGVNAPAGVAVLQSSGAIFATDPGAVSPGVQVFDATGAPTGSFVIAAGYSSPGAIAIDSSGSSDVVYVGAVDGSSHGAVLPYSTAGVAGTPLTPDGGTTFANPVALAVDPADGTVYISAVSAGGAPIIEKFNASGAFQASFDGSNGAPAFAAVQSLGIDGASRLYVSDGVKVYRYSAAGAFQLTVDDPSASGFPVRGIAVDATTNELYVNETNDAVFGSIGRIRVFSAGGTVSQQEFATAFFGIVVALAVNETSKSVLTADTNQQTIERYTAFTGPTVTTTAATSIDGNSETLNGTIDPEGISGTTYHFEWGADTTYQGGFTAPLDPGSGNSPVPVTDTATGLSPATTYHYRLVGTNANGTITANDQTFTTAAGPPVLDANPASANPISATGATLNGWVDARGSDTTYHFDYGLDTTYGSVTPDAGPVSGQGAQGVSQTVGGLAPGTIYHFRISADNGAGGVQHGADQTFRTGSGVAVSASSITAVSARFAGVVNAHGAAAKYHFEYTRPGSPSPVTATTAEVDASTVDADMPVTAISGPLNPATTYTVKVVIINITDINNPVTTSGAAGTFTTDPAPLASTGAVTGVTTNAARFSGSYDTLGRSGSYQFVIGSSTSPSFVKSSPVAVSGAGTASGAVDDLPAGQTYHVRLAVSSNGATVLGDTVTFSTPAAPAILPPVPAKTSASTGPYGCSAPVLDAYNPHPKPGEAITVTGADLGVGGNVTLGSSSLVASLWSATGLTIVVPDDASGSLALTVNCGAVSNTIAIQVYQAPSNTFTATAKASKTAATIAVSVKVPGPGSITVKANQLKTVTKHAGAAGSSTVKAVLAAKAARSLKRHHKLTVTVSVRFTPTAGVGRTLTKNVTFTRKPAR